MDDILVIAVAIAGVALAILAIRAQLRINQRRKKFKEEQAEQERLREIEIARQSRKNFQAKMKAVAVDNTRAVPPRGKETTVSYAPSPTQSVKSHDDGFMDGVMTAVVINTLLNSNSDSISGVVTKNEDTGSVSVKTNESSYGWGDSDTSSPKSSWSSSSDSSSSYSSSSDSGPSSDW
jgi:type II secretory pathway pseudopilin PulG